MEAVESVGHRLPIRVTPFVGYLLSGILLSTVPFPLCRWSFIDGGELVSRNTVLTGPVPFPGYSWKF